MITHQWRNQFKEIIDAAIPKDDPDYVDVYNRFAEKPPSVIDKMKAAQEKKLKELQKKLGSSVGDQQTKGVIQQIDMMMGDVS